LGDKSCLEIGEAPPAIRVELHFGTDVLVAEQGLQLPSMEVVDLFRIDQPLRDQDVEAFHCSHDALHFKLVALERSLTQFPDRFIVLAENVIDLEQELGAGGFARQLHLLSGVQEPRTREKDGRDRRQVREWGDPI
jgi:hypothetical protein